MEKLLQRFIHETDQKFATLHKSVDKISERLEDLARFKIEMLATARLTALVTSALCGFITLLITVFVALQR